MNNDNNSEWGAHHAVTHGIQCGECGEVPIRDGACPWGCGQDLDGHGDRN